MIADISGDQLRLERFAPAVKQVLQMGPVNGRVRLTMHGNSVAAMLGAANGDIALAMTGGSVSDLALRLAHLDVAERQNHALNAWLVIERDNALAEADAADARLAAARADGPAAVAALHPLLGLPVALKDLVSVAGGGDTVAALNQAGVAGDFSYVSTAGGAFLEWMEGKELPGVRALEQ